MIVRGGGQKIQKKLASRQDRQFLTRVDSSQLTHGANLIEQQEEACSLSLFHLLLHKRERERERGRE